MTAPAPVAGAVIVIAMTPSLAHGRTSFVALAALAALALLAAHGFGRLAGISPSPSRAPIMAARGLLLGSAILSVGILRAGPWLSEPALPFRSAAVGIVHLVCVDDLRASPAGIHVLTARYVGATSRDGWFGSARGRTTLVWEGPPTVTTDDGLRRLQPVAGDRISVRLPARGHPEEGRLLFVDVGDLVLTPVRGIADLRRKARTVATARLGRLSTETRALLTALMMGDRGGLTAENAAAVRRAGASHVLALSGMHLAVLAAIAAAILRPLVGARRALVLVAALLGVYVFAAGAIPSLVRALALTACATAAAMRRRRPPGIVLLGRAIVLCALYDPLLVTTIGFQLSVASLAGLMIVAPQFVRLARVRGALGDALLASAACLATTAPLSWAWFGEVYPIGIIAAIPLSVLATLLIWGGTIWFAVAAVPGVAEVMAQALGGATSSFHVVAEVAGRAPALQSQVGAALIVAAAILGLLSIAVRRRRQRGRRPGAIHFEGGPVTHEHRALQPRLDF